MYRSQEKIRPDTYVLIFCKIQLKYLKIRIRLLQLKSNEKLFYRKVTALVRYFAQYAGLVQTTFSKCKCVDEKRSSGGGNQAKVGLIQKWKHGID